MPSLPASLALTNVAPGAQILSADHRNNYAAIQAAVNAIITAVGVTAKGDILVATANGTIVNVAIGADGKVIVADASQASGVKWAFPPSYELARAEFTANVNIVGTSEGTATSVVSAGAVTFDGTPIVLEFWSPAVSKGTTNLSIEFFDGATGIGGVIAGFATPGYGFSMRKEITPSAGAHTYSVKAWVDAGSGLVVGGTGAAAANLPGFIKITKA